MGGRDVAVDGTGSVEGGREMVEVGLWNADGAPIGGGGTGDGTIFEATFQKSSKLWSRKESHIPSYTAREPGQKRRRESTQTNDSAVPAQLFVIL
jgi:hypothetical protein